MKQNQACCYLSNNDIFFFPRLKIVPELGLRPKEGVPIKLIPRER